MAPAVRALRGATTVDADTEEQVDERVRTLVREMLTRNGVDHDDLISIVFTATEDITSIFPAAAARASSEAAAHALSGLAPLRAKSTRHSRLGCASIPLLGAGRFAGGRGAGDELPVEAFAGAA